MLPWCIYRMSTTQGKNERHADSDGTKVLKAMDDATLVRIHHIRSPFHRGFFFYISFFPAYFPALPGGESSNPNTTLCPSSSTSGFPPDASAISIRSQPLKLSRVNFIAEAFRVHLHHFCQVGGFFLFYAYPFNSS